ncbi:MAG: HAD family hydrolase [Solirubrobacteraceae bacterium]
MRDELPCAAGPWHAILLDALGTLLALEPPGPLLRRRLAERLRIEISPAQSQRAIAAEIDFYRAHFDEGRDEPSLVALRGRCGEVIRSALPVGEALGAASPAALTDVLLDSLRFTVFPDVIPTLLAVRARGIRVVVVSNWDVSLAGVLGALGLSPLLDGVLTSAGSGVRKPAPAIFEEALALAGTAPQNAVHVGDSVAEDVAGALGAGIEPILLRRDGSSGPEGVRTIATLVELRAGSLRREP